MKRDNFHDLEQALLKELARIYPPSEFCALRAQYFKIREPKPKRGILWKIHRLLNF